MQQKYFCMGSCHDLEEMFLTEPFFQQQKNMFRQLGVHARSDR